jgi:hypothetical protein
MYSFSFSAAVAHKDENLAKRKLTLFEGEAGHMSTNASEQELITADVLAAVRKFSLIPNFNYFLRLETMENLPKK